MQFKKKKDDKKGADYLVKLYKRKEASEKSLASKPLSGRKLSKGASGVKAEVRKDIIKENSLSLNKPIGLHSNSSKNLEPNSSGKRPLVKPTSKGEPHMVKKNLVVNKDEIALKSREAKHHHIKYRKSEVTRFSEDENGNDSFIDVNKYEENDCEEMEYRSIENLLLLIEEK